MLMNVGIGITWGLNTEAFFPLSHSSFPSSCPFPPWRGDVCISLLPKETVQFLIF